MKKYYVGTEIVVILLIALSSLITCSKQEDVRDVVNENPSMQKKSANEKNKDEHQEDHENEHEGEHEHEDEEEHGEESSEISSNIAKEVGIETAKVGAQTLQQTIISYGAITTGSDQLSHVRARFPGQVQSVIANIGDKVKRGDLLAKIESNDSLRSYNLYAPISGVVTQRHANTGEFTGEQVLFSIANFEELWAEFRIYPEQIAWVKSGQKLTFNSLGQNISASIYHVVPVVDKPYQLARAKFNNLELGMAPGVLVEGHIQIGEYKVPLAVKLTALQSIGNREGIFVKEGDQYHFAALGLGRRDNNYVEVLSGIDVNQEYVSKNSYLIKADIEKSAAEHEH